MGGTQKLSLLTFPLVLFESITWTKHGGQNIRKKVICRNLQAGQLHNGHFNSQVSAIGATILIKRDQQGVT